MMPYQSARRTPTAPRFVARAPRPRRFRLAAIVSIRLLSAFALLSCLPLLAPPARAGYGDADYDCGTGSEYTNGEIENVAYSEDNALGHYPGLEDLGLVKRNNLAFWVPVSYAHWTANNTPHDDREYLAIFTAGAQGVGILGAGGRPNVTTGQRDQWSDGFGGGPDRLYRDVCDRGLFGRIRDDPSQRFPADKTNFVVNFDNRYLYTDEPGDLADVLDAWETYIKSLADPARLKGIYMVGASMGGGLVAEMTARLNASSDGWELVPIIAQGMDPVLGKNRLGTFYPIDPITTIDNFNSTGILHYFLRANNFTDTTFYDAFPDKDRIRMNTIIGGGVVVTGYNVRSYSYVQPAPDYNDYDLTWMRQTSVDLDHAVIGRDWNAAIVAGTGVPDSHYAMDHLRDSYNELDFWGDPVYYTLDASAYGGAGSHGVEHDWGDIQTAGSAFYTATDRKPVKLHESLDGTSHTVTVYRNPTTHADREISFRVTAPPYALGPNATYGADYVVVGHATMPTEGIEVFIPADASEASFEVETVYDGAVEADEHVYLEIQDGDYVGIRGNVQQGILMEIIDHNYETTPESCAEAGLLYDPDTNTCIGQCAPSLPSVVCPTLPTTKPYLDLVFHLEDLPLQPNLGEPLIATAQRAMSANIVDDPVTSRDELLSLARQVEALRGRGLTNAEADALIAESDAIVDRLTPHLPSNVPTLSPWSVVLLGLLSVVLAMAIGVRRHA